MTFDGRRADRFVDSGSGTVSLSAASTGTVTVTFARTFASPPRIVAMPWVVAYDANKVTATTTDATIRITHSAGTTATIDVGFDWIAVGDI